MNNESNYLIMAMSLVIIATSLPAIYCNLMVVGMCYGAALILIIASIKLKIKRYKNGDNC